MLNCYCQKKKNKVQVCTETYWTESALSEWQRGLPLLCHSCIFTVSKYSVFVSHRSYSCLAQIRFWPNFQTLFFFKRRFPNRYLEMWSTWLLSLFECHDYKTQIYIIYIVFAINWKTVKRDACCFYPFNMLAWFKQKSHASSIRAQNFIKLGKHSFHGNLILIYMWVFIICFLLSLLSLLLHSKCCDRSFLFGFSCLLETI